MKAEELFIGAHVEVLGKNRKIKSIVTKDTGVEVSFYGSNPVVVSLDMLQPIPLTPEILEKNGFTVCNEDEDGAVQYEFGENDLGVDVWLNTKPALFGAWRRWNNCNEPYSMVDELPINYIHELQHALRLCGIDKEIVI